MTVNVVDAFLDQSLTDKLLAWFDVRRRALPWRDAPCGARDPYRVWLAEIMLQQTTVTAVIPYFKVFSARWPDVKALAQAHDGDVMQAWAGLGYYARARNMLKCARAVANDYQGAFPRDVQDLEKLPGVGAYTAAAISAIAFNRPAVAVDGNVIRTLSRLYAIDAEMPKSKSLIAEKARGLLAVERSGDFSEALMDLGAGVCRPKNPDCTSCPWGHACCAYTLGDPQAYPKKAAKKSKPTRRGWIFWVARRDGRVLLERRPDKGLLGGMMGFPTTEWCSDLLSAEDVVRGWDRESWSVLPGQVTHTFTHFNLELQVMRVVVRQGRAGEWFLPDELSAQALPSVMQKVVRHALSAIV